MIPAGDHKLVLRAKGPQLPICVPLFGLQAIKERIFSAMAKSNRFGHDVPPPTYRDKVRALRYVPRLMRLIWDTHRGFTITMVILRLARAGVPVSTLWVAKLIVDEIIRLTKTAGPLEHLWWLLGLEIAIIVIGELIGRASTLVESLLGDLFANASSIRLMEHAARLDLFQFEDAGFYDHLERARRGTVGRIYLLTLTLGMAQDILTLGSLAAAIVVFNPWLLLLLAAAVLPSFIGETHFASLEYSLLFGWTPQRRELDYIRYVGASDKTAKEVQMFGLAPWLIERYRDLADEFYQQNRRLSIRKGVVSTLLSLLGTGGYYVAYALVIIDAVAGVISIGTLTFLASSFARGRDLFRSILAGAGDIYEQSLYLKDLFDFLEIEPTIVSSPDALTVPAVISRGFEFLDVGFRYPGNERWAVRHVNLSIAPGERIALVGENGAGKTTLTKLIARLYDPTEGRILLDGRDLRDYDLNALRGAISVIFQDFVRYDFRFDENIGVGEIDRVAHSLDLFRSDRLDDSPHERITDAAEKSLATTLLPRLPDGFRQMLGRRFKGGVDLSGGEWQKVALARAYMREAKLLILDEPTAALDARAEFDVFVRFAELARGRMAIIISHRFSTVRMADRIVVLSEGMVVEEGTHEELVEKGGLYADLFRLQAEGYR